MTTAILPLSRQSRLATAESSCPSPPGDEIPLVRSALAPTPERLVAKALLWMRIAGLARAHYGDAGTAAAVLTRLITLRTALRERGKTRKYVKAQGRYFWDLNCPGWPSPAFDNFIEAELARVRSFAGAPETLQTMLFAITKKCPLACEHCSEWDVLNDRETLTRDDLLTILAKFQTRGVAQVQLSGGEPLRRLPDLLELLRAGTARTDFWLLTSGWGLSPEIARQLRSAGLTGVQISLDHFDPVAHDRFRGLSGSFSWVVRAAAAARAADLAVCLNLCATREFVTTRNLMCYARLAARLGAGFIQVLEPRAVGHYRGRDVDLPPEAETILEQFFLSMNHDPANDDLPLCTYHAYTQRRVGCFSAGDRFLFVDTDGQAHACPFCRGAAADCTSADVGDVLTAVRQRGCQKYPSVAYDDLPGGTSSSRGGRG